MTWTKLGDDFCDRVDLLRCSRSARLLYVELLVYGNRIGQDGRIPRSWLHRCTDDPDAVDELIEAHVVEVDGDDLVVDWTDQELAEQVQARHRLAAKRQARQRAHKAGDHSLCNPDYCNAARDVTRDVSSDVTAPRPARPARPDKGREGEGEGTPPDAQASPPCLDCGLVSGRHAADCAIGDVA